MNVPLAAMNSGGGTVWAMLPFFSATSMPPSANRTVAMSFCSTCCRNSEKASSGGSLCVRTVPHSRAQMLAARAVLTKVLWDPARQARYGLVGGAGEGSVDGDPRTSVDALVYDEQVHRLRESAGADLVGVDLLLRKLA